MKLVCIGGASSLANGARSFSNTSHLTPSVTWPLLSGRHKKVIAATYEYDNRACQPSDQFGAEMGAIIELVRRTGLAHWRCRYVRQIADSGNPLQSHKPEGQICLDRTHSGPCHRRFERSSPTSRCSWSGNSKHKSLTGRWRRKLERLNDYLSIAMGRWNTHEISLAPTARHLCGFSASGRHQHARLIQDACAQIGEDYGKVLFAVGP